MKPIPQRTRQSALCPLSAFLLTVCFYFPGLAGANSKIEAPIGIEAPVAPPTPIFGSPLEPIGCNLNFNPSVLYDYGIQSSIAVNSSGLALEFHRAEVGSKIWYRVGRQYSLNKNYLVWGNSQSASANGYWPAVALTKEGYVIEVHSDTQFKSGSQQFYRVGKIDPNGDENQSISWKTDLINWDGGFHTSIAINDNGLIVGVHEINAHSGTGLYYRVGQLRNPAGGDYTIAWSSGTKGVQYDDGINPHIAINNHNQVVEVHEVSAGGIVGAISGGGDWLLHYRRGTISEGKITFAESQRYDDGAQQPAVALLDSGLVLEVHSPGFGLGSRTGELDASNSTLIRWYPCLTSGEDDRYENPALATNGEYVYQTHGENDWLNMAIYYSGTQIFCPNL
jgi:hypothetical protein